MEHILLWVLLVLAAAGGYKLICDVPSLLHTPLMSGMNALSGVVISGALLATALAVSHSSKLLGAAAIVLAAINVVGGFGVTDRMLKMFRKKEE